MLLLFLVASCTNGPSVRDIERELEARYRFFGEIEDVRIVSMVKIDENTYFAQVKYGIRFKKDIGELEREINEKLRKANIYKNLSLFVNILALNELVQRCGRHYIEKGRTCYLTENLKLVNVRGNWIVQR
ncbi:hypothetical protein [Hydrogenivirga sp.]